MNSVLLVALLACSALAASVEQTTPYTTTPYFGAQGYRSYPVGGRYGFGYQQQYPFSGYQQQYPFGGYQQQHSFGGYQQQYPFGGYQQRYPFVGYQQQYPFGEYEQQYFYSQLTPQYLAVPVQALQVLGQFEQRLSYIQNQLEEYQRVYPQYQWQQYVQAVVNYLSQVQELQVSIQRYVENNETVPTQYQKQVIQLYSQIYSLYQEIESVYQSQGYSGYQQGYQYPSVFQRLFPGYQGRYPYQYQQETPIRSGFGGSYSYQRYPYRNYQPYQQIAVEGF